MTIDGMRVFPRWPTPKARAVREYPPARLSVGVEGIDRLLGGGVPVGDAVLVEGPTGTGKSLLATHFIVDGAHAGESGLVFLFEERPDRFIERADSFDMRLDCLIDAGMADVLSFRGRDMSSDEVIHEMQRAVTRIGARRVVIDSAESLDLVLTGTRGLHDCLWRLLDSLTGAGISVWLNSTPDPARRSLAPLADDVLVLRRVEHETWIEHQLSVAKMRWGGHSNKLLSYQILADGVQVSEPKVKPINSGCLFDVPVVGMAVANNEAALAAAS
jgi:circadian clock protein KaiC